MSVLPDELWRRILEIGIESSNLSFKDLCCLSITSRRLRRLSAEDPFWASLLSSDFPQNQPQNGAASSSSSTTKTLYKQRYERDKERKTLTHKRAVLKIESEIALRVRKIRDLKAQSDAEKEKLNNSAAELSNMLNVRRASVALNVWQPEVIRGRQKQIVEQCDVPIDYRINALEMELKLCKKQIEGFEKALKVEKRRLDEAKEQLDSLRYHPLQNLNSTSSQVLGSGKRRKKLKHSSHVVQSPSEEK